MYEHYYGCLPSLKSSLDVFRRKSLMSALNIKMCVNAICPLNVIKIFFNQCILPIICQDV